MGLNFKFPKWYEIQHVENSLLFGLELTFFFSSKEIFTFNDAIWHIIWKWSNLTCHYTCAQDIRRLKADVAPIAQLSSSCNLVLSVIGNQKKQKKKEIDF